MRTGLHCNTVRDPGKVLDYYRRSGAKVAKFLEYDHGLFSQLRQMGVTIIGRVYFGEGEQVLDNGGKRTIGQILTRAREYPEVNYWEGYNEAYSDADQTGRLAAWELERMRAFDAAGLGARCLIGGWSCGTPPLPDDPNPDQRGAWANFRPALEYALAHGHGLHLHEYSGPFMQWMAGGNVWDWQRGAAARIDDPCLDPGVEGWLTLRYRKVWRMIMRPWGLQELPLFLTETGVDDVWPRPGPVGKGYKDYAGGEWSRVRGIGDYAQQRRWYMGQVSRDRWVRGVVDFGFLSADPAWGSFDLYADPVMLEAIIKAEADLPVGHTTQGGGGMTLQAALWEAAERSRLVRLNGAAALQRAMARDSYAPLGNEFDVTWGSTRYRAQLAGTPRGGGELERVYFCPVGLWDRVEWAPKV